VLNLSGWMELFLQRGGEDRMTYGTELETAVKAARAAGEMIRSEFYRPGGPRGGGDHAEIDEEAEAEIRKILTGLHEDWGYRGEETGSVEARDSESHVWLVDPNDGTSAFLRGYRGSAVSIALLRGGKPVLGVVYAPVTRDDGEDMIAWAEGCGPLRRNGREIQCNLISRALTVDDIVLVSHKADTKSESNARFVHPARYMAIPSIAYRLALAAVGEAAAAVSFNCPSGHDYGAGHALLIARGARLIDESGAEISYSLNGISHCQACFGGADGIVNELAGRNWKAVMSGPRSERLQYDLLEPEKAMQMHDAAALDRGRGCLMGQCAGDALGSLVEFQSPERIAARYPDGVRTLHDGGAFNTIAGQPTDDSEMALILARSIVRADGWLPEEAASAYVYWRTSGPFDIGATTSSALSKIAALLEKGSPLPLGDGGSGGSQANGSLMRVSPIGIWGHAMSPVDVAGFARQDSGLTHPNRICLDSVSVFAFALAKAISEGCGPGEVYRCVVRYAEEAACPEVLETVRKAEKAPPADYIHQMGWVLIALQNAFYRMLHASCVEEGIVNTIMQGGDTDTNAAIAGALLGAVHGFSSFPAQWRKMVLSCRPIAGLKGVFNARPRAFWPIDIPELAERLMVIGMNGVRR